MAYSPSAPADTAEARERSPRPRRAERPKRYGFLDRALIAREMGRL